MIISIIPPKVAVAVKKVLSDELIVQTVKIPSDPTDKVVEEAKKE